MFPNYLRSLQSISKLPISRNNFFGKSFHTGKQPPLNNYSRIYQSLPQQQRHSLFQINYHKIQQTHLSFLKTISTRNYSTSYESLEQLRIRADQNPTNIRVQEEYLKVFLL